LPILPPQAVRLSDNSAAKPHAPKAFFTQNPFFPFAAIPAPILPAFRRAMRGKFGNGNAPSNLRLFAQISADFPRLLWAKRNHRKIGAGFYRILRIFSQIVLDEP
jgi:hypothetical protein